MLIVKHICPPDWVAVQFDIIYSSGSAQTPVTCKLAFCLVVRILANSISGNDYWCNQESNQGFLRTFLKKFEAQGSLQ